MNKRNIIFKIRNLHCSYSSETIDIQNINESSKKESKLVLEINELDIKRGELTVLLGPSGSGKSTFLEAIGLMKDSISSGDVIYYPDTKSDGINFHELWDRNNGNAANKNIRRDQRSNLRRDNFSFIFQTTNFMGNFTSLENVALSKLINEVSLSEAKKSCRERLENLGIMDDPEGPPSEYSGGQRQRMAFARALEKPNFNVLFGDEPTGNLDVFYAKELWRKLKEFLANNPDKSVIIVTHSVELAVEFADSILVLAEKDPYHNISPFHCFSEDELKWKESHKTKERLRKRIEVLLDPGTTPVGEIINDLEERIIARHGSPMPEKYKKELSIIRDNLLDEVIERSKDSDTYLPISLDLLRETIGKFGCELINCYENKCLESYLKDFENEIKIREDIKKLTSHKIANTIGKVSQQLDKLLYRNQASLPEDFKKLFYKRETEALIGKNSRNLWLVFGIFFVLFISLGFAFGSIKYFREKSTDVFVRYVTSDIKATSGGIINQIRSKLFILKGDRETLDKHMVNDIEFFVHNYRDFSLPGQIPRNVKFRSIKSDDPLVNEIIKETGIVGKGFLDSADYGVIITRDLLIKKLGWNKKGNNYPKFLTYSPGSGKDVLVPVRAVVKALPDGFEMIATNMLVIDSYQSQIFKGSNNKNNLMIYVDCDLEYIEEIEIHVQNFIDKTPSGHPKVYGAIVDTCFISSEPIVKIEINFDNSISQVQLEDFFTEFASFPELLESIRVDSQMIYRGCYFTNPTKLRFFDLKYHKSRIHEYTVVFKELKQIKEFAKYLEEEINTKFEMTKIEQLRNYSLVVNLARILAFILIIFSSFLVSLFLSNILSNHLQSIKMNVGTFKAFGIEVNRIYFVTMQVFLVIPMVGALIISGILGYTRVVFGILQFITGQFRLEKELYFDFNNWLMVVTIVIIITINIFLFKKIINNKLGGAPSDLIYDRDNKS